MPRSKDATVWNEKLKKALQAREDVARRQGKKQALLWNEGWRAIEAVRGDIYTFSTGRIVNLPMFKKKTLDNLCRAIIAGTEPVLPAGYIAHEPGAVIQGNPYQNDPYLNSIKKRGGAFAILMAFYVSPANQVLTKQQICETGQSFCDTEMEENYFAGRSRGAWAAVKTLASHGLVTVHKAVVGYNARAGGLRSHGPSTYTLTQNGTLFTEALLQKNPDIQQQVQAVRGRSTVTPSSYPLTATWSGSNAHTMADPATARNIFADLPDSAIQRPVAEGIAGVDEQELREWLEKALPGHQKEFNVGKDRRKRLRDLCDELNRTALNGTGMQLHHESDGYTKSRELFVTLQQRPHRKIFGDYDDKSVAFETLSSRQDSFPIKSSPPRPRVGHTVLDHESPAKRRLMVPAWVAAANAALERQAIHESLLSATATTVKSSKPKLQQRPPQVTPLQLPKLIDLLDDDSDEGDRKMPANPYKYPIVLELDAETSDSESDDDIPESVLRKKETTAKRDHRSSNSSKGLMMKHSMDEPVDLTESQESQEIVVMENYKVQVKSSQCAIAAKRGQSSRNGWIMDKKDDPYDLTESRESQEIVGIEIAKAAPPQYALVIYIDDRERNRNRSPRTLRLELTRLLSTGLLSMVWPQSLPNATVEEHRLEIGDFAFGALPSSRSDSEIVLPVSVERKRIGDLVQRSYRKDHWYQLHRMQEEAVRNEGVCVLLLEGDSRTAAQYAPSGAQEVETISPFDHTIDDEDSLFRFMGRVILNGMCMEMLQYCVAP